MLLLLNNPQKTQMLHAIFPAWTSSFLCSTPHSVRSINRSIYLTHESLIFVYCGYIYIYIHTVSRLALTGAIFNGWNQELCHPRTKGRFPTGTSTSASLVNWMHVCLLFGLPQTTLIIKLFSHMHIINLHLQCVTWDTAVGGSVSSVHLSNALRN